MDDGWNSFIAFLEVDPVKAALLAGFVIKMTDFTKKYFGARKGGVKLIAIFYSVILSAVITAQGLRDGTLTGMEWKSAVINALTLGFVVSLLSIGVKKAEKKLPDNRPDMDSEPATTDDVPRRDVPAPIPAGSRGETLDPKVAAQEAIDRALTVLDGLDQPTKYALATIVASKAKGTKPNEQA